MLLYLDILNFENCRIYSNQAYALHIIIICCMLLSALKSLYSVPIATRGLDTPFMPTFRSARSNEDRTASSLSSRTELSGERNQYATSTTARDKNEPYLTPERSSMAIADV